MQALPEMRFRQNPAIAARVIEGKAVLIVPATAEIKGLNAAGTHLWQILAEPRTLEALADALLARFAVSAEAARVDAEAFVRSMIAKGLLVEEPEEKPA